MPKHFIIYSHGFGVEKDDRGLFSYITSAMPDIEHVTFDYNIIDRANNTLTVSSLREQSKKFTEVYNKVKSENPDAVIDLICHSQGCLVAAIANPEGIRNTIFLAPPDNVDIDRFKTIFDRPGAVINLEGQSKLTRKDGSTTIVPKDYWDSLKPLNVMKLYDMFSQRTKLTIIEADEDDVLGSTDFTKTDERIGLQHLRADHNFTGEARQQIVGLVKKAMSANN